MTPPDEGLPLSLLELLPLHRMRPVFNQKDETLRKMSVAVPNLAELTADAKPPQITNIGWVSVKDADCIPRPSPSPSAFLSPSYGGYDTYLLGNFFA